MTPMSFVDVTSVMGLPRNLKSRFYGQPLKKFTSTVLHDQGEISFVLPRNNELDIIIVHHHSAIRRSLSGCS